MLKHGLRTEHLYLKQSHKSDALAPCGRIRSYVVSAFIVLHMRGKLAGDLRPPCGWRASWTTGFLPTSSKVRTSDLRVPCVGSTTHLRPLRFLGNRSLVCMPSLHRACSKFRKKTMRGEWVPWCLLSYIPRGVEVRLLSEFIRKTVVYKKDEHVDRPYTSRTLKMSARTTYVHNGNKNPSARDSGLLCVICNLTFHTPSSRIMKTVKPRNMKKYMMDYYWIELYCKAHVYEIRN